MKYGFLHFELDTERFDLVRKGEKVVIQPQALTILSILLGNRNNLMLNGDLIQKLWSGRIVSDSTLSSQIKILRRILGNDHVPASGPRR